MKMQHSNQPLRNRITSTTKKQLYEVDNMVRWIKLK